MTAPGKKRKVTVETATRRREDGKDDGRRRWKYCEALENVAKSVADQRTRRVPEGTLEKMLMESLRRWTVGEREKGERERDMKGQA